MKYSFEKIIDRTNSHAKAVDIIPIPEAHVREGFSKIPMWVADMNFETVPTIPEKIIERTNHHLYGYFIMPDTYYESIIKWQENRNQVKGLKAENIAYENGLLGGVVSAINILTSPGDKVLVHSPTYVGFTNSLTNKGYGLVHSDLYIDEEGIWRMDYEEMERKIVANKIHTAIFCNPHNPTGRVWSREEIEKAYEIYKKHDVYVVEDCIWSDIILGDNKFTPAQSINEDAKMRTISFYAPSKTFNLAGLVGSYHIVYNKRLNDRLEKESSLPMYNHPNLLSVAALEGAYSEEGSKWTDELRKVLTKNIDFAYNYIKENFKGVKVQKPQGTYLLYLDLSNYLKENNKDLDTLLKEGVSVGVIWQDGRPFNKDNTIRMNLALPYSLVVEAFERLDKYVFNK